MDSRIGNSLRNARYGMLFYLINLVASFFMRRYFIFYLGDDLLGLNGTLLSILGFLNIAELGLNLAVGFALYKPLAENNQEEVCEIVSLLGWYYRIVAGVIFLAAVVLLFFFPSIMAKATQAGIPMSWIYGTYGVLLLSSLLGYLFNYRLIVFSSDQAEWGATVSQQLPRFLKQVLQCVAIVADPIHGYLWWMALEGINAVVTALFAHFMVRHYYPWLHTDVRRGRLALPRYPQIRQKTRQVLLHKLATFIIMQSTPLVILAVFSAQNALYQVALYQNYMIFYSGLLGIFSALFNGITASVGNLALEGTSEKAEKVFRQLASLRLFLAAVCGFAIYFFSRPFMQLWVGGERYFTSVELLLFTFVLVLHLARLFDHFLMAYGKFQDVLAPFIESVIQLGLAFYLGQKWGLSGVFVGMLASVLLIVYGWKPYFLYRSCFSRGLGRYALHALWWCVILIIPCWVVAQWIGPVQLWAGETWWQLIVSGALVTLGYTLVVAVSAYLLHPDFRSAMRYVQQLIRTRMGGQ